MATGTGVGFSYVAFLNMLEKKVRDFYVVFFILLSLIFKNVLEYSYIVVT